MLSFLFLGAIPFLFHLAIAANTSSQPILEPISDVGWSNAVQRRSVKDSLALLENEHLVWSSAPDSSDNIFVNMTMFTGEDELIISMERFAQNLKAVNCSQDMMMAFNSNSSYQQAIKSWDWVNFSENRTFIMIANSPGCGGEKSRQPWVVSNVQYDSQYLLVQLNATKKSWKEVAHTYNMDFGRYSPPSPSGKERRLNWDKQINLDLAASLPTNFYTSVDVTQGMNIGVTCTACGTKGTLTLAGHIETSWFSLKTFSVSANPTGVEADLNLALAMSGTDPSLKWSPAPWDFFTIPLDGFSIPDLITLGPALTLGAGVSFTALKGKATLSTSITATVPDSSIAQMELVGDNPGVEFQGWVPQWNAGPLNVSEQISASASVYANAKIGIVLEIMETGLDLGFDLQLPSVTLTASATHDDSGVCSDKEYTDGVSLALTIGADLSIQANTDVVGDSTTIFSEPVYHIGDAWGPPAACFGFGSPVGSS